MTDQQKEIQYDASIVESVHDEMIKEIYRLQGENARLRSALRTIVNWDDDLEYQHGDPGYFAQDALKGGDTCKS